MVSVSNASHQFNLTVNFTAYVKMSLSVLYFPGSCGKDPIAPGIRRTQDLLCDVASQKHKPHCDDFSMNWQSLKIGYGTSIFQSPARRRKLHEREKGLQKGWMTIFSFH
uniref:Uncharacterized protein n=1 Tax=Rhipicephalus zambeziensis TaxID=60191 RepID=A0A224YGR8_9ACAR